MDYIDYYKDSQLLYNHNKDNPPFFHDYGMHAHDIYELFYLISGEGTLNIEGTPYPLTDHSVYLIRANEAHYTKLDNTKPFERICLHFYPEVITILDPNKELLVPFELHELGEKNFYPLNKATQDIVENAFQNIAQYSSEDTYLKRLSIIVSLLSVLTELNKLHTKTKHHQPEFKKHPVIGDVLTYINAHLFEEITTEDLCEQFFISRSHLSNLFKECTSSTIWNYILTKRMVAAKTMLQNGISAKEVATICGYQDYSAFYRAYKKHFKTPPAMK